MTSCTLFWMAKIAADFSLLGILLIVTNFVDVRLLIHSYLKQTKERRWPQSCIQDDVIFVPLPYEVYSNSFCCFTKEVLTVTYSLSYTGDLNPMFRMKFQLYYMLLKVVRQLLVFPLLGVLYYVSVSGIILRLPIFFPRKFLLFGGR